MRPPSRIAVTAVALLAACNPGLDPTAPSTAAGSSGAVSPRAGKVCVSSCPQPEHPPQYLYVVNQTESSAGPPFITVYATETGNVAPVATIAGSQTGLVYPLQIALDNSGRLYEADYGGNFGIGGNYILVFAPGVSGNVSPIATIQGDNSGVDHPTGVAIDNSGYIYVANFTTAADPLEGSVTVYAPGTNGNVSPVRTITGSKTLLDCPWSMAVDSKGNTYVFDTCEFEILVFSPGANGNVSPAYTIGGDRTQLPGHGGDYLTIGPGDSLYVAFQSNFAGNNGSTDVAVFAPGAEGNVSPTSYIAGSNTGLGDESGNTNNGVAVDEFGDIFVSNVAWAAVPSLRVFAPGATGNVSPIGVIQGSNTRLNLPTAMAIGYAP
jgi:hypothetical protein